MGEWASPAPFPIRPSPFPRFSACSAVNLRCLPSALPKFALAPRPELRKALKTMSDTVWETICAEVRAESEVEPTLASYFHEAILNHSTLEEALSYQLANKLSDPNLHAIALHELILLTFRSDPKISVAIRADIKAAVERDPACQRYSTPVLFFKGFLALQAYRVSHALWNQGRQSLARYIQSRTSEIFAVDIHPAARIGHGILIDHATGVVVGETAVVENNVSMLHNVTLGGTGKEHGDRHPKIREGVLLSAGAKVLGNVEVGAGAKVGAGSVVLRPVPPHRTAVGVPAQIIGTTILDQPALDMDHSI